MSQPIGDNLSEGLSATQKKSETYYDSAMRWIEDTYLKYFGENRTSYGVKGTFGSLLFIPPQNSSALN